MTRTGDRLFDRWGSFPKSTWPFQVFQRYQFEFDHGYFAHRDTARTVYRYLKNSGAQWTDAPNKFMPSPTKSNLFTSLKQWSDAHNQFENWINLNIVVSITSNIETYLATIVSLAVSSDPGILLGQSRLVDGVRFLLQPRKDLAPVINDHVMGITKGDWSSRIANFKKLFGQVPPYVDDHIAELDDARHIRNRMGHAFGRDIEASRDHTTKTILPMEKISDRRLVKLQRIIRKSAKEIDKFLLTQHIGEYQAIAFYHRLLPSLAPTLNHTMRAKTLKKELGKSGVENRGKEFCKGLVSYYESL